MGVHFPFVLLIPSLYTGGKKAEKADKANSACDLCRLHLRALISRLLPTENAEKAN